ncbi:MAG: DUF86 domain-containing protein, partial [Deinococcota bacterium]|nr:DUF86 domain-containing protein [Deinococcota bacterium]
MKDPRVYLAQMLERIWDIEDFTQEGEAAFYSQKIVQDATMRCLQVMGEAAKRVPESYRATHPEIPWRSVTAFRDVLVHNYEGVDLERVWDVVEKHLPPL